MELLHRLKICYKLLTSKHYYVFICPSLTEYYQSSHLLTYQQANTAADNLDHAIALTEKEEELMSNVRDILGDIDE